MSKTTCEFCRHYGEAADNMCKLNPPVVFVFNVNPTTKTFDVVCAYPKMPKGNDDWCGQWVPKDIGKFN